MTAQEKVEQFNKTYKVGTFVAIETPGVGQLEGKVIVTKTRTTKEAFVSREGNACVFVREFRGPVNINRILVEVNYGKKN